MHLARIYTALFFIFLVCCANAPAQSFLPVCNNFGPEDYGEDAEFRCGTSDNHGTLYFGTNYGILVCKGEKRAAGKNWRFMLLPQPDVVLSLYMDTLTQRLYVGAGHDFGYFDLKNYMDGSFVSLQSRLKTKPQEVWHIEKCDDVIYFHSIDQLITFEHDEIGQITPGAGAVFHNVFRLPGNKLLINALEDGWYYTGPGASKAEPINGEKLPSDKCYAVLSKPGGGHLFFFRNSGVYKSSFGSGSFSAVQKVSDAAFDKFLANEQVYGASYSADSSKIILATLTGGAYLIDGRQTFSQASVLSSMQKATGIQSVYGLFTDPLHNIWVLGKRNLSVIPADLSLSLTGLTGVTVRSLAIYDEALFVACGNGLFKVTPKNDLFTHPVLLSDGSFTRLAQVGDTLFGTTSSSIVRYFRGKISTHASPFVINDISSVRNALWISTRNGLFGGLSDLTAKRPLLADKDVLQVIEADSSVFVLIHNEGVIELNESGHHVASYPLSSEFTSTQSARLFRDGPGILVSNLFDTYTVERSGQSLRASRSKSRLWMYKAWENGRQVRFAFDSTNTTRLEFCDSGQHTFRLANAFMSPVEIHDAVYYRGNYYLGSKNGLYVTKLYIDKPAEQVRLFKLTAGPQVFYDGGSIRIAYKNNRLITINCALSGFYNSSAYAHYAFRLIPYDTTWDVQATSEISFSNLPWGNYVLEVKAIYGNNQETLPARLNFTLLKPWWAGWWGILLWITLFVCLILVIVQASVYRLKKSKIKLEQIVQERTQEIVYQKNEIESQKEEIEHKNREITDSINYARRIQNSLLKGEGKLAQQLPGSFVLYLPKDIVSGDFYWFSDISGHQIAVVADCTGHGVPGAFMSMLGVAALNEAAARNIYMPHLLLQELNHLIVETLGQDKADSDSRDGMDVAILCLDQKNKKLFYAGANRSLLLYNKKERNLTEIKPTKLPVGGGQYGPVRQYQLHELALHTDLSVYLCTDGYADQFGGPKGKKFMSHKLYDLFKEIGQLDAGTQQKKLQEAYEQWKGKLEQVDDVCVLGINFDFI